MTIDDPEFLFSIALLAALPYALTALAEWTQHAPEWRERAFRHGWLHRTGHGEESLN